MSYNALGNQRVASSVSATGAVTEKLICLRAVIVLTTGTSITLFQGNDGSAPSLGAIPTATAGAEYHGLNGIISKGLYAVVAGGGSAIVVYDEL